MENFSMQTNKKDDNGWVLCPSKSLPGKYYYFNVVNGEAVWSLPDAKAPINKGIQNLAETSPNFPEPEPANNNENRNDTNSHQLINSITVNKNANKPIFGQISFPNYMQNVNSGTSKNYNNSIFMTNKDHNMQLFGQGTPKVVWTPNAKPNGTKTLDQVTQTCELENIFVHSCDIPLSKRFINYETPRIRFTRENKLLTNNIYTSTPLKSNPLFIDTKQTIGQNNKKRSLIKDAVLDFKKIKFSDSKPSNTSNINLFLQNQVGQTVLQSNKTCSADLNMEAKHKEASRVQGETKLVKLDRNDLRLFLMARKRKHTEGETTKIPSETKKIKLKYTDDLAKLRAPKKQVTFATDSPKIIDTHEYSNEGSLTIQTLKNLAKSNSRQDVWYIVVDMEVLLDNYEFLNNFVLSDESCRLLIPEALRRAVEALCAGDSAGRSRVHGARRVARSLRHPPAHLAVRTNMADARSMEFYNDTNEAITDDILNCCLQMKQKHYVVLLSNDDDLVNKATVLRIHAFKFEKIKDSSNQPNSIRELNTNKTNLFLTPKFKSIRSNKTFENIPGLMEEISTIRSNDKIIFDDDSVTSDVTSELNRGIRDLKIKNHVKNSNEYPFHFQKPGSESFESQTKDSNKINFSTNKNFFENKVAEDKAESVNPNETMNAVNIPNLKTKNIDKDSEKLNIIDKSVENNLRRFYITYKAMEDTIKDRMEEFMCIFTQIMEDALCYVLQNSSFQSDFILPWSLEEMIERIKLLYKDGLLLNVIVDKLSSCMSQCMMDRDKITPDIKPQVFIRTIGCGILLIQCLKSMQPNYEELGNAKQSLMNLLRTIENPIEMEFDNTPKTSHSNVDEERRQNYIKQPKEIITYLKRHYKDWGSYDDMTNQEPKKCAMPSQQENPKVFRVSGKNLNMLKIDNKKTMTITNCPNEFESNKIKSKANNPNSNNIVEHTDSKQNNGPLELEKREFAPIMTDFKGDLKSVIIKSNINDTSNQEHNPVDNLNQSFNNSFDAAQSGPKVTRRLNVIKEYKEKIIRKTLDMDALDYSEITSANENGKNENKHNYVDVSKETNLVDLSNYSTNVDYGKTVSGHNNSQNNIVVTNLTICDKDSDEDKDDNAMEKDYISISDATTPPNEILTKPTEMKYTEICKIKLIKTQPNCNDSMDKIVNANEQDHISISDNSIEDDTNNIPKTDSGKVTPKTKCDIDSGNNKSDYIKRKEYHNVSDTTSDSGIGSDRHMTYSLVKVFLSKLSYTFSLTHDFMVKNLNVLREEHLADDVKSHLHGKVKKILKHMGDVINELKNIIQRESNENVALHTLLAKIDEAANDKRITRYRSVMRKCLEQAQNLQNALKIMHSVIEADWDGSLSIHAASISSSIRYLNIFE